MKPAGSMIAPEPTPPCGSAPNEPFAGVDRTEMNATAGRARSATSALLGPGARRPSDRERRRPARPAGDDRQAGERAEDDPASQHRASTSSPAAGTQELGRRPGRLPSRHADDLEDLPLVERLALEERLREGVE